MSFRLENLNFRIYVFLYVNVSFNLISVLCSPVIPHIALLSESFLTIFTFEWLLFIMFSEVIYYIGALFELHTTIFVEALIRRLVFVGLWVNSFNCLKPTVWDTSELFYLLITIDLYWQSLSVLITKSFDRFSDQWMKIDWLNIFVVFLILKLEISKLNVLALHIGYLFHIEIEIKSYCKSWI